MTDASEPGPEALGRFRRAFVKAVREGKGEFEVDGRVYETRFARYILERLSEPGRAKPGEDDPEARW